MDKQELTKKLSELTQQYETLTKQEKQIIEARLRTEGIILFLKTEITKLEQDKPVEQDGLQKPKNK